MNQGRQAFPMPPIQGWSLSALISLVFIIMVASLLVSNSITTIPQNIAPAGTETTPNP
ncbi:hypothetical protein [Chloroflexus sp.]|uniref:hypothetical protein n=1 Tax=Chloroflexus sp. TaxID=1904827 RepID=UPI003C77F41D